MSNMPAFNELFSSPLVLIGEDTKANGLMDCMDNQPSDMQDKANNSRPPKKRKRTSVRKKQHDSIVVSNDSGSNLASTCEEKKRKVKAIKLKDEQLDLQCEWRDCDYRTCSLDDFVNHVSLHIPQLEVKMIENKKGIGSIVFPRILLASISTWHRNLSSNTLAHIILKYCKTILLFESSMGKCGE
jgi:hypothetical protein